MTSLPERRPDKRLGLAIDLDTCVGCHACAVACKEWNTGGYPAPLSDADPYGAAPGGAWLNRVHGFEAGDGAEGRAGAERSIFRSPACIARTRLASPSARPARPTSAPRTASCWSTRKLCMGCGLCAWACPYGAREMDPLDGVMKKCTLCIDRIYNQNLAEEERVPACVSACPVSARHFGDFADPESAVSQLVAERGTVELLPEMGYRPTNAYLPPRARPAEAAPAALEPAPEGGFLGWLDRVLSA